MSGRTSLWGVKTVDIVKEHAIRVVDFFHDLDLSSHVLDLVPAISRNLLATLLSVKAFDWGISCQQCRGQLRRAPLAMKVGRRDQIVPGGLSSRRPAVQSGGAPRHAPHRSARARAPPASSRSPASGPSSLHAARCDMRVCAAGWSRLSVVLGCTGLTL